MSRALALIADGALDGEDSDVETLAERLGVGGRQLRRLFQRHLGASPIAVAQTRRVLFAKQLLHDTHLPMAEVALASGFGSVRRFNETFRDLFGRPPSALRRKGGVDNSARDGVTLRLAYRPPYDWPGMLAALVVARDAGIEWIDQDTWHRRIDLDGKQGSVAVAHLPARNSVMVTIRFPCVKALPVDRGARAPRVRPRRRHRHHRQPPRARSQARAADQEAPWPARAGRLGARDHGRRARTTPRPPGGRGTPMPHQHLRMANHG